MSQNDDHKILTQAQLEQIRGRCEKAILGPWISYVEGQDHTSVSSFIMTRLGDFRGEDIELSGATIDDQDFITYAKPDIPRLLKEIERLYSLIPKQTQKQTNVWVEA